MKEYREIRDKMPFLSLCKDKDLVTQVTVGAQEKIGADAAIIFSDILLIVEAFGLGLDYLKGDACLPARQGPSIKRAIKGRKDIEALPDIEPVESLAYVFQAIHQTRASLKVDIPLLGFAGAPFTLASYMIEGGASKDFSKTRKLMASEEEGWHVLMEKISKATVKYLNLQIESGAQAVQLFDSWVGCLSPEEYERYALPYSKKIIQGIKAGAPVIHFGTGTAKFLDNFSRAGSSVVGVDHRIELGKAWKKIGYDKAIQGNLDPKILLGTVPNIKKEVKKILDSVKGREGHIFNLGHGVLPETPVENVIALVDMVHELSQK